MPETWLVTDWSHGTRPSASQPSDPVCTCLGSGVHLCSSDGTEKISNVKLKLPQRSNTSRSLVTSLGLNKHKKKQLKHLVKDVCVMEFQQRPSQIQWCLVWLTKVSHSWTPRNNHFHAQTPGVHDMREKHGTASWSHLWEVWNTSLQVWLLSCLPSPEYLHLLGPEKRWKKGGFWGQCFFFLNRLSKIGLTMVYSNEPSTKLNWSIWWNKLRKSQVIPKSMWSQSNKIVKSSLAPPCVGWWPSGCGPGANGSCRFQSLACLLWQRWQRPSLSLPGNCVKLPFS